MKKILLGTILGLYLFSGGVAEASAITETDVPGTYETSSGIRFQVDNPGNLTYTGIEPDEPASGYDVFTKKNCDVGVKVTYDAETDQSTYVYDYVMNINNHNRYWAFDLGNNKITKNDDFDFYVVNTNTSKEYLVDDMENKSPNYFSFYTNNLPYGGYQLKIVVKGDKTTTMNGVDIIEELSGENAVFGECGGEGESPCTIPTSKTVYDYFYYNFEDNEGAVSTAKERFEEYISKFGYDNPYDEQANTNRYLMDDILDPASGFNHAGHLYKYRNNCSFFLYTKQTANYPTVYVNGIFETGLLYKYFNEPTIQTTKENEKDCGFDHHKYRYDFATYLKNGHTSQIEYYTLSLKYSYDVYTLKNYEELSFKGYQDRVANQMGSLIDTAYENGVHSRDEMIASLNQQITNLNQQLTTKEQEKAVLQSEIEEKNRTINSLQTLIDEKQEELSLKESELASARNQVSVLTSQIKEKEEQLTLLLNDTNAKTEEIASLRNSIDTLTELNKTANQKVTALEKEKQELNTRIASLNQQLTTLQSTVNSKQEEIINLNKELQTLNATIADKEKEIETLERVISFKDDKITALEKEKEENKFLSSNGYWKKVFNFAAIETWNIYCWITWIGLGLIVIAGLLFWYFNRKRK